MYRALAVSLAGCGAARSTISGAMGGVNRGASDAAGNTAAGAVTRRFGGPSVPGAPAGNFTAKHIRYSMMGGGTYEWWMAEGIPGGVAKCVVRYQSDSYTQTLVAMARDARTELGSY